MCGTPVRRGILALDIEGFGQARRTDPDRARLRADLHTLLDYALTAAQMPSDPVNARSDLGDGVLVLFDPAVSAATLLHPLLTDLTTRLTAHNQTATGLRRLRLRIAVHEGYVLADAHGFTGEDLNHAFRLLDAEATHMVLANSPGADAVLVVSDGVYWGIVRHAYQGLDPDVWRPVRVHAKETTTRAWVHLPGISHQPAVPAGLAAPPVGLFRLPIPRELPGPTTAFTGRARELQQLTALLDVDTRDPDRPVVISAIDGKPGIGKSALAIHSATQLADRFPDGQLYINLHGATPGQSPVHPLDALGHMLRSLGVDPTAIPADVEEAAARWRSLAAERRLLVVLDNAHTPDQVQPLLPGSPTCAVLITSRQMLATLDGTHRLHLDLLPDEQAVELLARIAGQRRVAAEPEATAEIVRLCGWLPLAIRIAGVRLTARPPWPVRELSDRLADASHRLDELTAGGLAVRAAFDVSLESLQHGRDPIDHTAAQAFGFLSLPDGADLDTAAAARLLDQPERSTQTLLERLVDAQLLETPQPGRYQFHDLVRLYAREHAARQHPETERLAALTRLFSFYTATAWHTLVLLRPGDHRLATVDPRWGDGGRQFTDAPTALAWLEAERANLLAAITQAANTSPAIPAELPGQLTRALFGFFDIRGYWTDGGYANQTALGLARRADHRAAQAHAHNDLGGVYFRLGRYQDAAASLHASLTIFRELGDPRGQAFSLGNLGSVWMLLEKYEEAIACLQASLTINRDLGDRRGEAFSLDNLGAVYERLGRYQEAIASLSEGIAICRKLGDLVIQASSLDNLGTVHSRLGRHDEAIASLQGSLTIHRELGNRLGQSEALRDLGDALVGLGRHQQAREALQESLEIRDALHIPEADEVRSRLATLSANPKNSPPGHWQ